VFRDPKNDAQVHLTLSGHGEIKRSVRWEFVKQLGEIASETAPEVGRYLARVLIEIIKTLFN